MLLSLALTHFSCIWFVQTLQNDVKAFQKQAKKERLSKADTDARVASMERIVNERHAKELAALQVLGTHMAASDRLAELYNSRVAVN